MRVAFLGDVVGEPGRQAVKEAVGYLRERWDPDFFVVNGENAAGGKGITPRITYELLRYGADVITLGDHAWDQREILPFFVEEPRLIRPLNYPPGTPGSGYVVVEGNGKKLAVVCAQGRTFMGMPVDNPFLALKELLPALRRETPCVLVDFHAEATSEKAAMGWYLDGLVSAVVGTHTHVQTADERILPGGTAYITDVGFCGAHDSVIGREKRSIIERYLTLLPTRMLLATEGIQADGVLLSIEEETGRALRIERFQIPVGARSSVGAVAPGSL
jgi:metallophosphoesterase (TIGR00282 family)